MIRTPDQRLRVFVSAAMAELAEERRAVARAISALRLTPVLFEAGARPQPPRDVYQAYLAQSDIFIGLYWEHYGQVNPGMEVSGLENEFDLSDGMPRLLYVKVPAPKREPRLADLLSRVRQGASYRRFRTAAELGRLVRDDLATLLSERFDGARPGDAEAPRASPAAHGPEPLPVATTSLVGREQDIAEVAGLIRSPDTRLVTLTGPGGIGKTRLALAVGERTAERFPAGVAFVPLEAVTSPEAVLGAVGREVGAEMAGAGSPLQALVDHFGDGRWLLILDNLEQVVEAAHDLNDLLARCPGVTILATCLIALRLRAESEYAVPPLALPPDPATSDPDALAASPPVQLFVDRARAVRHDFALTPANAAAVAEIARRLEGLPLAIELAAARSRLLDPDALLERLRTSFDALGTAAVDVPERQRTLRATVEWSMGLLDDDERSLLETMAVLVDGFTVEAAAEVAGLDEERTLDLTERLAGHSLIVIEHPEPGLRSRMLDTIRAFVCERLAARADLAEIQQRQADHYRTLAERADRPLRGFGESAVWVERLQAEAGNLAAAVRWYLVHDRAPLPHLFRVLSPFRVLWPWWGLRNEVMGEARGWVADLLPGADALDPQARAELLWTATVTALEVSDDAAAVAGGERLGPLVEQIDDPYLVAVSHLVLAWTAALGLDLERATRELTVSVEDLRAQDEPLWLAIALVTLGATDAYVGRYDEAQGHLGEVRDIADRFDNARLGAIARAQLGRLAIARGRLEDAGAVLSEGVDLSLQTGSTHALTMVLAACAQLAIAEGDAERAALIAGAAEGLRVRAGLRVWMSVSEPLEAIAPIREALGPDRFDEVFAAGAQLSQGEAVEAARAASAVSAPAGAGPPAPA